MNSVMIGLTSMVVALAVSAVILILKEHIDQRNKVRKMAAKAITTMPCWCYRCNRKISEKQHWSSLTSYGTPYCISCEAMLFKPTPPQFIAEPEVEVSDEELNEAIQQTKRWLS